MAKVLFVVAAAVCGVWLAGGDMTLTPRALQFALVAVVLAGLAGWMGRER